MNQVAKDLLSRFLPKTASVPSKKLNVAVVGGGPAGLLLTWKLLDAGHEVAVFERREAYQLDQSPDPRSHNLTADGLGLRAFGRLANLIYCAGIIVDGRAIHSSSGTSWTHPYGHRSSDHLVSVPRGDLLALLYATISDHPDCELHFNCEVEDADLYKGTVRWRNNETAAEEKLGTLDLIVFADGVGGVGQRKAKNQPGVNSTRVTEYTPYLNLTISKEAATQAKLELNKIHFFPADESLGIGLPNFDGTISLLIEGRIHKNHRGDPICPFTGRAPFSFYNKVFTRQEEALSYLASQNPKLGQILKDFPEQVLDKRPGPLGILVGDAGSCAPPWAGFGMNLACSHAADLARLIGQLSDVEPTLEQYNKRRQKCTEVVKDIIREHGALLNSGIGSGKWRREQALRERREQMLGERSTYQIVAFEEGGLEHLAGLE
jgi:2-polyprenyl-6-methoxyphenol hydroxylase-like FAD-dependent oxidoreductase